MFKHRKLGEILVSQQALSKEELKNAEGLIGEKLVKMGLVSDEELAKALAVQFSLPYLELKDFQVASELFEYIPAAQAFKDLVLPVSKQDHILQVAVSEPLSFSRMEVLERQTGLKIRISLSTKKAIQAALKRSEGSSRVLKDVSEQFHFTLIRETGEGELETLSLDEVDDSAGPVVKLTNSILEAALQRRASDIHIETGESEVSVKFRIDGILYSAMDDLDISHHSSLVSRIKIISELDIAEKRIPQDGRFKLRIGEKEIDFRVSVLPGIYGEDVVIRVLDKSYLTTGMGDLNLKQLGLQDQILSQLRKNIREPYGMVLISGPTGSGKTTTLYAALSELNTGEEKVITIEDPIEYKLNGVVQIPVNEKKGLTFASGLRSILRHDPDKIMVGEIRDADTLKIAVQSALTGHLVFSTVHANNAFDIIGRFQHMGVDISQFASALNCVLAQRLVRKICPDCKKEISVSEEELQLSGLTADEVKDRKFFEGKGCSKCAQTGYLGRMAITELLEFSSQIREMIMEKVPLPRIKEVAVQGGMIRIRQSALEKVFSGETTLKEINRVTFV